MDFVTHGLLITVQTLAFLSYTAGSYRLFRERIDRVAIQCVAVGVALDVTLAFLGAISNLGNNPEGMSWNHPLFGIAVFLATLGMTGHILNLVLLSVRRWRERSGWFLSRSQVVIWLSWVVGVTIFIVNVFIGWF